MSVLQPFVSAREKCDLYDQELVALREKITKQILAVRREKDAKARAEKANAVKESLDAAKKVFQKMVAVMKTEKDPDVLEQFLQTKKLHKDELNKAKTNLQLALKQAETIEQSNKAKEESFEKKSAEKRKNIEFSKNEEKQQQLQEQLEKELFKDVFEAQQECLEIVERLNIQAVQTTQIALDTTQMLAKQKEQLYHIDRQMDELGSNTKRAAKELRVLMRRLATDKLIIVGVILLVLAGLVFLAVRIGKYVYDKFKST